MIGLLVLGLLAFHLKFAYFLARYLGTRLWTHGRVVRTLLLFLIFAAWPFADEIVGRVQFSMACHSLPGPTFFPALETAHTVREDSGKTRMTTRNALIPIDQVTAVMVDADTGAVVYEHTTLFTSGGLLMQAGLNLGNFSTCNQVNPFPLFAQRGFEPVNGGSLVRKGNP